MYVSLEDKVPIKLSTHEAGAEYFQTWASTRFNYAVSSPWRRDPRSEEACWYDMITHIIVYYNKYNI